MAQLLISFDKVLDDDYELSSGDESNFEEQASVAIFQRLTWVSQMEWLWRCWMMETELLLPLLDHLQVSTHINILDIASLLVVIMSC